MGRAGRYTLIRSATLQMTRDHCTREESQRVGHLTLPGQLRLGSTQDTLGQHVQHYNTGQLPLI